MDLVLSRGIRQVYPDLEALLYVVWGLARYLDADVPDQIEIFARLSPAYKGASGMAWSCNEITLCIGRQTALTEIVKLCAHELRHLAQFKRGEFDEEVESDAYAFEEHVANDFINLVAQSANALSVEQSAT